MMAGRPAWHSIFRYHIVGECERRKRFGRDGRMQCKTQRSNQEAFASERPSRAGTETRRTGAPVQQRARIVEEEQRKIEDAAGHWSPVHQHVLLKQVPPPRPHLRHTSQLMRCCIWSRRAAAPPDARHVVLLPDRCRTCTHRCKQASGFQGAKLGFRVKGLVFTSGGTASPHRCRRSSSGLQGIPKVKSRVSKAHAGPRERLGFRV